MTRRVDLVVGGVPFCVIGQSPRPVVAAPCHGEKTPGPRSGRQAHAYRAVELPGPPQPSDTPEYGAAPPAYGVSTPSQGTIRLVADLDPDIRAYYEQGREAARLHGGARCGPLERVRTQELISRYLPLPPLDVLDVGGAAGVHAAWLSANGYRVHLVDPVPLHVDQATAANPAVTAEVGDARCLAQPDDSVDAVLLLGPLYHLIDRRDRVLALSEAARVLRSGGVLYAAAICRFAPLLDLLVPLDRFHEPDVRCVVEDAIQTGVFLGLKAGMFTTAYLHQPGELLAEVAEAGFVDGRVFNVEGPGHLIADFEARWADAHWREALLVAARLVEEEPEMMAAAGHLLAVGRLPEG
ncbi:MAG TPA: class I SAM-dependent methyltransferase [Egibacteraceae bacterium]|nr:class I SAM-dependent methyltransferase [Egibacteraceae bacterium]